MAPLTATLELRWAESHAMRYKYKRSSEHQSRTCFGRSDLWQITTFYLANLYNPVLLTLILSFVWLTTIRLNDYTTNVLIEPSYCLSSFILPSYWEKERQRERERERETETEGGREGGREREGGGGWRVSWGGGAGPYPSEGSESRTRPSPGSPSWSSAPSRERRAWAAQMLCPGPPSLGPWASTGP